MKPRVLNSLAAFSVAWIAGTSANAQLELLGAPTGGQRYTERREFAFIDRLESAAHTNTTVTLRQWCDWTQSSLRGNRDDTATTSSYVSFGVGDLPVELRSMTITWNAKWILGGGGVGNPLEMSVRPRMVASIYEDTDGDGPDRMDLRVLDLSSLLGRLDGNGSQVFDGFRTARFNHVLAADTTYYLQLQVESHLDARRFNPQTPSISLTNEAGAILSGGHFSGYGVLFEYRNLPAPGVSAVLAGAAWFGAVRRRRS